MSKDQSGPTRTIRIAAAKRGPRLTMEINSYGLHHGPAEIRLIWHHTGGHRSANQNEPFHSMLEGPQRMAVRQSLHERDSQATRSTTWYHHRQGDTIHLRPMEGNYGEIKNRTKTQHGFPSTNRQTDRTDQCHIRTIPPSLYQLSTRQLVWLPTTGRVCIQQQISRNYQEHTILCELWHQPRIRDDRSSDSRKAKETRRIDSVTWVIEERNGGSTIMTKKDITIHIENPIRTYNQGTWCGCYHATSRPRDYQTN